MIGMREEKRDPIELVENINREKVVTMMEKKEKKKKGNK